MTPVIQYEHGNNGLLVLSAHQTWLFYKLDETCSQEPIQLGQVADITQLIEPVTLPAPYEILLKAKRLVEGGAPLDRAYSELSWESGGVGISPVWLQPLQCRQSTNQKELPMVNRPLQRVTVVSIRC